MIPVPKVKSTGKSNAKLLTSCTDYMHNHNVTTKPVSVKVIHETSG